jgi:hypothetical protein
MLVLALEFSRGWTAHAWEGHHPWTKKRPGRTPPDRGTHGVSGRRRRNGQEEHPGPRSSQRARLGRPGATILPADTPEERHRDRPIGPLPQNEIVRVQQNP